MIKSAERKKAQGYDGKIAILTNVQDMPAKDVLDHYRERADIERERGGVRTMKSDLSINPVHHRLPDRIKSHSTLCYLALLLHRIMRSRLRSNGSIQSPNDVLRMLQYIKLMDIKVNGEKFSGISKRTEKQLELFEKLEVEKP